MKVFVALALILAVASAQSSVVQIYQQTLNNNPCYRDVIMKSVLGLAENVMILQETQDFSILENALVQAAEIKAGYEFCNMNIAANGSDVIENLGVGSLLLSQCLQDVGGLLLIADTII